MCHSGTHSHNSGWGQAHIKLCLSPRPLGSLIPGCYTTYCKCAWCKGALGSKAKLEHFPRAMAVAFRRIWLALCSWECKEKIGRGCAVEPVMRLPLTVADPCLTGWKTSHRGL